jgi:hypothetical protein
MHAFTLGILDRPGLLWWLALAIALLVGVWSYYRLLAPLGRAARIGLRALRIATLLLVLGLLLQPMLTLHLPHTGKPTLAVLIDRSSSMRLPGMHAATRAAETEAAYLRLSDALAERFDLVPYTFSASVASHLGHEVETGFTALPTPAGATAIGDALEGVLVQQADAPLAGIVLLTDGVHTAGKDPGRVVRNLPVPVFSVVAGDTVTPPDLRVRDVRANPVAYVGEPMAIEVVLEGYRLAGWDATVAIREVEATPSAAAGGEIAHRSVQLASGPAGEASLTLEVTPAHAGLTLYEIMASIPDSEAVKLNNVRRVAVEVREKKTRVLYVEGEPDWDFSFLKRAFDADTTLAYTFLVRETDGAFTVYGRGAHASDARPPQSSDEFEPYAAVIVGHLGPGDLPAGFAAALKQFLLEGGGVLFLAGGRGADLSDWAASGWEELLPLRVTPQPVRGYRMASPHASFAGLTHEITGLGEGPDATKEFWSALPPIWLAEGTYDAAPGASVLLTARVESPLRETPLLAVAAPGSGRIAVLAGRGAWRWDFVMRSIEAEAWVARDFWKRMSRWLSEPGERDRFVVRPARMVFQDSEPVEFAARLLDDAFQPISGARIDVTMTAQTESAPVADGRGAPDPAEAWQLSLYPEGSAGRYTGRLGALSPGAYRYEAEASTGRGQQRQTWRAEGRFWVEEMGPEFLDLAANRRLPAHLARATGGRSVSGAQVDELIDAVPRDYRATDVVKQAELWNHWPVFAAVTALLAAEWFLRRRRGLA